MSQALKKKLLWFQEDHEAKARFQKEISSLPISHILWPEQHEKSFASEFQVHIKGGICVFPLYKASERLDYAEYRLNHSTAFSQTKIEPIFSCFCLTFFEEQLHQAEADHSHFSPFNRVILRALIQKTKSIKKKIKVPKPLRQSSITKDSLFHSICDKIEDMSYQLSSFNQKSDSLEEEIEKLQIRLDSSKKKHSELQKVKLWNRRLRSALRRERRASMFLEKELDRFAKYESMKQIPSHSLELSREYFSLEKENRLLIQKNNSLMTYNLELSDLLKQLNQAANLETILTSIRDRINLIIRNQKIYDEQNLIQIMKDETIELRRARSYLGKVLYNLGILYLKTGDPSSGFKELRAAKQLGVSDSKVEELFRLTVRKQ